MSPALKLTENFKSFVHVYQNQHLFYHWIPTNKDKNISNPSGYSESAYEF
jgi:hypothetical protein